MTDDSTPKYTISPAGRGNSMDTNFIIQRAKLIMTDPKAAWGTISGESTPIPDLYKKYVAVLAALPPLCQYIAGVLAGQNVITGLIAAVVGYGVSLAMIMTSESLEGLLGSQTSLVY